MLEKTINGLSPAYILSEVILVLLSCDAQGETAS